MSGDPEFEREPGMGVRRLERVMARLHGPEGCPWDREQTLETLKPFLLEEAYELLDVMSAGDSARHAEELGDVLLQVVFQTRLREATGEFTLDEVAHRAADKLVRRHPHVFGDVTVRGSDEVIQNWEAIKRRERADDAGRESAPSALDGIPRSMPSLLRAQRVQGKASAVGFDWPDRHGPEAKIAEELDELRDAVAAKDREAIRHEIGDLLFSVVNLCRFLKVDAESALREAVARFDARFRDVEAAVASHGQGSTGACSLETLDRHWDAAKRRERARAAEPDASASRP